MFENLKEEIKEIAYSAVTMAEDALGSSNGQEKKILAIEFIVSKLPVMEPFKKIIIIILGKFIDRAVEEAVAYMKSIQNEV